MWGDHPSSETGVTASLSDSAHELLDALEHVLTGDSPAAQWWVALAEHERDLAKAATDDAGLDLDELSERARQDRGRATPLGCADVSDRATERAAEDGRDTADIADVAAALLACALSDWGHRYSI